ncbi:MAG: WecB/TagA/CpsF family glycosyltransferase [Neomegalonema sp.]|nr:WecB/TagA/CpsF family glycosyltransferase [Neomegalonema sp.]
MEMITVRDLNLRCLTAHDLGLHLDEPRLSVLIPAEQHLIDAAHGNEWRLAGLLNDNFSCLTGPAQRRRLGQSLPRDRQQRLLAGQIAPLILERAREKQLKLFLLGGTGAQNEQAVSMLAARCDLQVSGHPWASDRYPFAQDACAQALKAMEQTQPHILLLGLGFERGLYWIDDNRAALRKLPLRLAYPLTSLTQLPGMSGGVLRFFNRAASNLSAH